MSQPRKRARKTFSCSFCRLKKKKCDQQKPACSYCIRHDNAQNCDYTTKTYTYGVNEDQNFGIVGANEETTPKPQFIEYDVTKIISSRDKDHYQISKSYLESQIKEYQTRLNALELSELMKKADQNPSINSQEEIDLFLVDSPMILLRTNCITDVKPLSSFHIFGRDPYVDKVFKFANALYTNLKSVLKEKKLNSDFSLFMHHLPTALHEDFRSQSFLSLFGLTLNKRNPFYEYNFTLLSSLHNTKSYKTTFLNFDKSSEELRGGLIKEVETILPRLEIILFLWDNFENYIYPFVPVLDLKAFKKDLELIIVGIKFQTEEERVLKSKDYKVLITTFIDLSLLATFLVILRTSYLSLKLNIDFLEAQSDIQKEILENGVVEYIGPEYFNLASNCLSQVKALKRSSINVIAAILHIFYYMRTCEELANSLLESEKQILYGNLYSQVSSVGIYRDWEDVPLRHVTHNYSGLCVNKENLVYFGRKLWHLLKRFGAEEGIVSGAPVFDLWRTENNVKLPATKVREDWIHPPDLRSLLIDDSYKIFENSNKLLQEISAFVFDVKRPKLKQIYGKILKVENILKEEYSNPKQYFDNDENFKFHRASRRSIKEQHYFLVLNKVFRFEKYLQLMIAKLKLSLILLYHFESTNNLPNYLFFLNKVCKSVVLTLETVNYNFMTENQTFLKMHVDKSFKALNHKLLPIAGDLIILSLYFVMGYCYRLFNAVFTLSRRAQAQAQAQANNSNSIPNSNNVNNNGFSKAAEVSEQASKTFKEDQQKLEKLIELKDVFIKVYDYIIKSYQEKTCKFYNHIVRYHVILRNVFVKLKEQSKLCEEGKPFDLLAFKFDIPGVNPSPDVEEICVNGSLMNASKVSGSSWSYNLGAQPPKEVIFTKLDTPVIDNLVQLFANIGSESRSLRNETYSPNCAPPHNGNFISKSCTVDGKRSILNMADEHVTPQLSWLDGQIKLMESNDIYKTFIDGYLFKSFEEWMERIYQVK